MQNLRLKGRKGMESSRQQRANRGHPPHQLTNTLAH